MAHAQTRVGGVLLLELIISITVLSMILPIVIRCIKTMHVMSSDIVTIVNTMNEDIERYQVLLNDVGQISGVISDDACTYEIITPNHIDWVQYTVDAMQFRRIKKSNPWLPKMGGYKNIEGITCITNHQLFTITISRTTGTDIMHQFKLNEQ